MDLLTGKLGRALYALPFGVFGVLHLLMAKDMTMMVPSFIPGGILWVYLTGAALIAACISILINRVAQTASLCLAALLAIFIVTIHVPGLMDVSTQKMAMSALLKDMALCGAALVMAGVSKN